LAATLARGDSSQDLRLPPRKRVRRLPENHVPDREGFSSAFKERLHFREGERLRVDGLSLEVLYTPGHTDDSRSFLLRPASHAPRVFTGDTLLIRGTGRTDFQNGDAAAQYDSLFGRLLKLPEESLVYPAHDYNGMTVSTIGEERRFNPRLQVKDKAEYVALMNGLELDNPRLMDIAVPANRACGLRPNPARSKTAP